MFLKTERDFLSRCFRIPSWFRGDCAYMDMHASADTLVCSLLRAYVRRSCVFTVVGDMMKAKRARGFEDL